MINDSVELMLRRGHCAVLPRERQPGRGDSPIHGIETSSISLAHLLPLNFSRYFLFLLKSDIARSDSRFSTRVLMSSRLSCASCPLPTPSSTFTHESFQYDEFESEAIGRLRKGDRLVGAEGVLTGLNQLTMNKLLLFLLL